MKTPLIVLILLAVPLSGCFDDIFGGGCRDDGGHIRWVEPGIYEEVRAVELPPDASRTHVHQPAGRLFDHQELNETWGGKPYLVLLRFRSDVADPAMSLEMREGVPKVVAVSLGGEDDAIEEWARAFVPLWLRAGNDPEPVVERIVESGIPTGRGDTEFYRAEVTEPLVLEERFNASRPTGQPDWALIDRVAWDGPEDLTWEFNVRALEVTHPDRVTVQANQADWVRVPLERGQTDDAAARAVAREALSAYGLEAGQFNQEQVVVQQVCT